jgi:hypothetical protein
MSHLTSWENMLQGVALACLVCVIGLAASQTGLILFGQRWRTGFLLLPSQTLTLPGLWFDGVK